MKRIVLFIVAFLSWAMISYAQDDCDCYTTTRAEGIQLMQKKEYAKAIEFFKAAADCPDKPANNDLMQKRQECLREIQKLEEQRQQQEEDARRREAENQRRAQAAANARKGYIDIQRVSFANVDKNENTLTDYGGTLYMEEVCYVKPKLYYNGLTSESRSVDFMIKIINPDGSLRTGTSSPAGYTLSDSKTIYPGNSKTLTLKGWGRENPGGYSAGTYRFEVWYSGERVYSTTFEVKQKAVNVMRLTVDNKTAVTSSFSASGGTETFFVSTDAAAWTTWGVPSWCSIEEKTSTSFKLRCTANTTSSQRKDYMKVKAGDKDVRIDITQSASGSQASRIFEITRVAFANVKGGNTLTDYGGTLYTEEVCYLGPKLYYNGLTSESRSVDLMIKIINPDGSLRTGTSSPTGYTRSEAVTIYPGNSKTLTLLGWGRDYPGGYLPGTYQFEVWYSGERVYSTTFEVKQKAVNVMRLTVDNKTAVTSSFSASGGTETFFVSTDAAAWTTWGVPSWCSIEEKTSTSFKLRCTANTTSSQRKDYMKVKAGDKDVRIDITQSASGSQASRIIEIIGTTFSNVDNQGNILSDYGVTLYSDKIRYVKPKVYYQGFVSGGTSMALKMKIIRPDGSLISGTNSPSGYSWTETKTVYSGDSQSFTLLGWGSESGGTYSPGTYRFEIWYEGNRICTSAFEVK